MIPTRLPKLFRRDIFVILGEAQKFAVFAYTTYQDDQMEQKFLEFANTVTLCEGQCTNNAVETIQTKANQSYPV